MYGVSNNEFRDETGLKIHSSEWLQAAYTDTIRRQTAMAARNRTCREERSRKVNYKPGDSVLYWQPGIGLSQNDAPPRQHDAEVTPVNTTPKKWSNKWSGPHEVVRSEGGNHYIIRHCHTAQDIKAHVNRLCAFYPWSDDLPSTSMDLDSQPSWKVGGQVDIGSLIIIPLQDSTCPFGVARLLATNNKGIFKFRWLSNRADNVKGTFQPGWLTKSGECYYADRKRHKSHAPYLSTNSDTKISAKDIILHGFDLTDGLRIPAPVLRAVSKSGWVDWQYEPSR